MCFFGGSFFKKILLTFGIIDESNIWANVYHIWKEYRLDQLNSTHTNSSKLDNTVFWRLLSKEISAKSLMFFGPPTTKWRPCKIFVKLNSNYLLMANIFKLHKYKTFGLMKMHNMCKIWFANNIFSLLRWNKKYFSWFFKGFQLPEIVQRLWLYWILKEDFV